MNFLPVIPENIPQALQALEHWHPWRWELNPKTGKYAKVPRMVGKERRASSTNPATWTTFSSTLDALQNSNGSAPFDGAGFALEGSNFTFGDIDHCVNPETGAINYPWVSAFITELNTYTERSPSGTGLHFWLQGTFTGPGKRMEFADGTAVELYCRARYAAMTGVLFPGSPKEIRAYDVQSLYARLKNGQLGPNPGNGPAPDSEPQSGTGEPVPDLRAQLESWGLVIESEMPYQGTEESGTRYKLQSCIFNPVHEDAAVFSYPSGPVYSCFHNSCEGKGWSEVLNKFEPVTSGNPKISPFPALPSVPYSEDQLALQFVQSYGQNLRYVSVSGSWLVWTGQVWAKDEINLSLDLTRELCRKAALQQESITAGKGRSLSSARFIQATERLARSDTRIAVAVNEWDPDPWLLNTQDGVIDLRSGELLSHERKYFMTKICGCGVAAPDTVAPLWTSFLKKITNHDTELENYLQRLAGYCLTGSTRENALFFCVGTGRNGKGVFKDTLAAILANYAKAAAMQTFLASSATSHPTDLAHLCSARFVTATENNKGDRWDESKILALTGDDPITCRYMRQDFFTYQPTFKLFIAANNKPALRSVNEATRARLHLIPFQVTIPKSERDPELKNKLRAEWPAILRWAINGGLEWQQRGLNPPAAVVSATEEYLAEENVPERWMASNCLRNKDDFTFTRTLFSDWKAWAEEAGEYVGSEKAFSQNLRQVEGLRFKRTNRGNGFEGISLKPYNQRSHYEPPQDRNPWSRKMGQED